MARRSYLERIARPLKPGDPVLFPTLGAPADEARPAAVRPPPAVAPRRPPAPDATVHRRAALADPAPIAARADVAIAPVAAPARSEAGAAAVSPSSIERRVFAAEAAEAGAAPRAASAPVPPPATSEAARRAFAALDRLSTPARAAIPAIEPPESPAVDAPWPGIEADRIGAGPTREAAPAADRVAPAKAQSVRPSPSAPPSPPTEGPADAIPPAAAAAPPRIHIGAIEVRAAAPATPAVPPAPPAAPAAAARAPFAPPRGYVWRFGLVQG